MPYFIVGITLLIGALLISRWYVNAAPSALLKMFKWGAIVLAIVIVLFFLVFGPKLKGLNFFKKRESAIKRGEEFFDKYGWSGILIGRIIPAIRPFMPFIAGLSSMRTYIFIVSSILACVIWSIALAFLIIGIDNIINFFNY